MSCHPKHCTKNIPFCLARRIKAIVSEPHNVNERLDQLKQRLKSKGYPDSLITAGIDKALQTSRDDIIFGNRSQSNNEDNNINKPVFFVSTHNPRVKNMYNDINGIVGNLNRSLNESRKIDVMSSFRKSPSLKNQLMFRILEKPQVRKCGKNCIFCDFIQTGNSITLKNGQVVSTNSNLECSSRNVIYIANCLSLIHI